MITPYVYYVKHRETGKFYFGFRKQNVIHGVKPEDDLWKKYFTSSRYIKRIIKEFGIDSFDTKIVFIHPNAEVCFWHEQELIKSSIKDKLSLNYKYIDFATGKSMFGGGNPLSEETKKKISIANKGKHHTLEFREALSKRQLGTKKSKPRSIESRIKMSLAHHGLSQCQAWINASYLSNIGRKWPKGSRHPRGPASLLTKALMKESQLKRRERERIERGKSNEKSRS
jgi:hypothetical protein